MDEPTRQFLADAARIRLKADEKEHIRADLSHFMAGDVPLEELEPALQSFFREAADISLLAEEAAGMRGDLEQFMAEEAVRTRIQERHVIRMDERSAVLGNPDEISLTDSERVEMRRNLLTFMDSRKRANMSLPTEERLTLREYLWDFWRVVVPRTAVLACAFLIVSTGVAFAAEGSLPGDWLYPLKVQVFEQVRGRFIFTPEEKAQWEAQRAMRRLEEAVWLAAHDDLTEANWVELHGNFVQHVVEAERQIDALANAGDNRTAEHLSADLDAYLSAHHTVLQAIGLERREDPEIKAALENVQETQQSMSRRRDRLDADDAPEDGRVSAESGIRSATMELSRVRRGDDPDEQSQAAERLRAAERMLDEANVQFDAGRFKEAEQSAREAVKNAAEAKLLRRLPRELPVPAAQEKESDPSGDNGTNDDDASAGDAGAEGVDAAAYSSVSSTNKSDSRSSASSEPDVSSVPASTRGESGDEQDEDAEIDVGLPGADARVDLDGLLD